MQSTAKRSSWVAALDLFGRALWHVPGRFRLAALIGPTYTLRCLLFHHIADTDSNFTKGLDVTTTRHDFESALKFVTRYYTPVSLQDVVNETDAHRLPALPALVTFDDAYASISEIAAPLCKQYGVPAAFFINASCIDNQCLSLDNLICYAVNIKGLDAVGKVAAAFSEKCTFRSMKEMFSNFLPTISLVRRDDFRNALTTLIGISEKELAERAALYLSKEQMRRLASSNVEVGNHTYTHVNGRILKSADFGQEIDRNKSELQLMSGQTVSSFSVPYGSEEDLPSDLLLHLRRTGHTSAFLVESQANQANFDHFRINRVSIRGAQNGALFSEIEILPRFRSLRASLSRSRTNESASPSLEPII